MKTNISGEILNKSSNNLRELQNYSQVIYDLIDQVLGYYIKKEKLGSVASVYFFAFF